jgi:transaldolase/glucose-6-phosphate isomerase
VETAQTVSPVKSLLNLGQSVWLDYIRRDMLLNGELSKLIKEDGLRGMTSNPAIFQKAIGTSTDYDNALQTLVKENLEPVAVYEKLAIEDVQKAADLFKTVYDETKGLDGYVSLEVSPYLASESKSTIAEAKRLWQAVHRPNVMIKVPGTKEGIIALEELIAEGINVNVTLLFSMKVYEKVAQTYIRGLERYAAKGGDISKVASVASFFISRIDSAVDKIITKKIELVKDASEKEILNNLLGKTAIANAKVTYQLYKDLIKQSNWLALSKNGAMPQRLLWASTSTKNPQYRDVYYVEQLIGQNTVDTIPPATYDAFKDHGKTAQTLETDLDKAKTILADLKKAGISLEEVCDQLVIEGIKLFADPFDELLTTLKKKCAEISANGLSDSSEDAKKPL